MLRIITNQTKPYSLAWVVHLINNLLLLSTVDSKTKIMNTLGNLVLKPLL